MRVRRSIILVAAAMFVAAACSSSSNSNSNSSSSSSSGLPTRSATCLGWQKAECDHLVGQCSQGTRADCDTAFQSLFCKSDSTMQACIDALAGADCSATPTACQGVADPQPAIDYCNKLVDTLCTRAESCGQGTKQDCLTSAQGSLDCSKAVGVASTADACLHDLQNADCSTLSSSLPASCNGVVKAGGTTATVPASSAGALARILAAAASPVGYVRLTK